MNLEDIRLSERSQTQKAIHRLNDSIYIKYLQYASLETESRLVVDYNGEGVMVGKNER